MEVLKGGDSGLTSVAIELDVQDERERHRDGLKKTAKAKKNDLDELKKEVEMVRHWSPPSSWLKR